MSTNKRIESYLHMADLTNKEIERRLRGFPTSQLAFLLAVLVDKAAMLANLQKQR